MSTTAPPAGRRPEQPLGRPRDSDRTEAILAAAGEVLHELGYDRLRIQDVAERAGSGTGAIYRRWATKEALVADTIRSMPDVELDATDDPVADLRSLLTLKLGSCVDQPDLMPGMVAAMRTNPEIADAIRERYTVDTFRNVFARLVGDDDPRLDLLAELAPAIVLHRVALSGQTVDLDELASDLVELAGAVDRRRQPA